MKKLAIGLIFAIPIALFGAVAYLILFSPSASPAALDHSYRQAAYAITWAIQLGYLAWLGMKWWLQKHGDHARKVNQ